MAKLVERCVAKLGEMGDLICWEMGGYVGGGWVAK